MKKVTIQPHSVYHVPALLTECIDGLCIKPDGHYIDVTFGGGGHSRAIMEKLGKNGRLMGMDQDLDAFANALADERFTFAHGNFAYVANFARYYEMGQVDGILADLGVSFHHFDEAARGFSFRGDAPLDMRMNGSAQLTAAHIVASYDEQALTRLFTIYGELRQARRMASAIVKQRAAAPIATTGALVETVKPFINPAQEKKELSQVFQALRIEVNHEMDALEALLRQSLDLLKPGGRLVVLSYHSLEDRMVKNFMRSGNVEGKVEKDFYGRVTSPLRPVNRKVIMATDDEVARNPRARSAKLRIGEKI